MGGLVASDVIGTLSFIFGQQTYTDSQLATLLCGFLIKRSTPLNFTGNSMELATN